MLVGQTQMSRGQTRLPDGQTRLPTQYAQYKGSALLIRDLFGWLCSAIEDRFIGKSGGDEDLVTPLADQIFRFGFCGQYITAPVAQLFGEDCVGLFVIHL